eukprot:gene8889-11988_t
MGDKVTSIYMAGSFTPMERIVLSANGNLQRILSAYYGAPINVVIRKCDEVEPSVFDREVDLVMSNQVICTAKGKIIIYDPECIDAVAAKKIGIGQLFRYLGVLPTFSLLTFGRNSDDNSLFRDYELSSPQLKCRFRETFKHDFLTIQAN